MNYANRSEINFTRVEIFFLFSKKREKIQNFVPIRSDKFEEIV